MKGPGKKVVAGPPLVLPELKYLTLPYFLVGVKVKLFSSHCHDKQILISIGPYRISLTPELCFVVVVCQSADVLISSDLTNMAIGHRSTQCHFPSEVRFVYSSFYAFHCALRAEYCV
jgi:hypothetical protein